MRKKMKKVIAVILTMAMAMSVGVPAFAAEDKIVEREKVLATFTMNEYDAIVNLKTMSTEALEKSGYSSREIKELRNFSYEKALLEKASLSEDVLRKQGYTAEKIAILKAYDGGPLENNPQLRGVFADLSGTMSRVSANSSKIVAKFAWTWASKPMFAGTAITDIVACGFSGANTNSLPLVVTQTDVTCTVEYYSVEDNTTRHDTDTLTPSHPDPHGHVEVDIPMGKYVNNIDCYAKKGTFTVGVKEEAENNSMYSATFAFGYGHQALTLSPSITVTFAGSPVGGISLSFGYGTSEMYDGVSIIRTNGNDEFYLND